MAMVMFIFHRFKSLFLMVIGVWRRALCCFRRKRRPSCERPLLEGLITCDHNGVPTSSSLASADYVHELTNWNSWDENGVQNVMHNPKPNTVQEHIELYRQQACAARSMEPIEEQVPDFFEDMVPKITEQPKVFIRNQDEQTSSNPNRLSLAPQPVDSVADNQLGDLGEWDEQRGWEEEATGDWDSIESVLRANRKQEREKRQQFRQYRMTGPPPPFGTKISS